MFTLPRFAVAFASVLACWPTDSTAAATEESGTATFEEQTLDLSVDWGEARACASSPSGTRCYRSEQEMDRAEASFAEGPAAACSSSLRLYSGTN